MKITKKVIEAFGSATSGNKNWKELNAIHVGKEKDGFRLVAINKRIFLVGHFEKDEWDNLRNCIRNEYGCELPKRIAEGFIYLEGKKRREFEVPFFVHYEDDNSEPIALDDWEERAYKWAQYEQQRVNIDDEEQLELLDEKYEKEGLDLDGYKMKYPDYKSVIPSDFESNQSVKIEFSMYTNKLVGEIFKKLGLFMTHIVPSEWKGSEEVVKVMVPFDSGIELYIVAEPAPSQEEMEE